MTIAAQQAERRGAAATIRRGLGLSPELRSGLPATLVLALLATAGRVIVPVAVQQIIDGGFAEGGVDIPDQLHSGPPAPERSHGQLWCRSGG